MTPKEQAKLQVLNSLLTEQITLDQAAELMGVSPRHARRILAAYRENGAAALTHGLRGHRPANAIPDFGRAMDELGVHLIFALSPQAKGRVERTAGTFQDWLITELRLARTTTMEEAQAVLKQFLPRCNRRFGVPSRCPESAFRPLEPGLRLAQSLCFKHRRRVARDNSAER